MAWIWSNVKSLVIDCFVVFVALLLVIVAVYPVGFALTDNGSSPCTEDYSINAGSIECVNKGVTVDMTALSNINPVRLKEPIRKTIEVDWFHVFSNASSDSM